MIETLDNYMERAYADFVSWDGKVLVYPIKIGKGKPQRWTVEQARQYVRYLENEAIEI